MNNKFNFNVFNTICFILWIIFLFLLPNNNFTFNLKSSNIKDFIRNSKYYSNNTLKIVDDEKDEKIFSKRINLNRGNNLNVFLDLNVDEKFEGNKLFLSLNCQNSKDKVRNTLLNKDSVTLSLNGGKNIINENLRYRGRYFKRCRFLLKTFSPTRLRINDIRLNQQYEIPYYIVNLLLSFLLSLILTPIYLIVFSKFNKNKQLNIQNIKKSNSFFTGDISDTSLIIVVGFLFLLSFVLRFNFANFYKVLGTYIDEPRYYFIANSFTQEKAFTLYNARYMLTKILYPLLISPAFLFENYILRIKNIALINSFLLTVGVFPVYLLAKKLLTSNKLCLLLCVVYLLMADQCYSMLMLSEVAFIPLSIYCFYLFFLLLNYQFSKYKYLCSFLTGGCVYLLYLCKDIGVIFLVAHLIYIFIRFISCMVTRNNEHFLQDKKEFYQDLKFLFFVVFGFFTAFLVFKYTIFYGMPLTYQKMNHSVIFTRFNFTIYAYATFCLNFLTSYLFIPVLIPILFYSYLPKTHKKTLLYLVCFTILLSIIATCMVTVRDEFFSFIPRTYSRYFSGLAIPFFIYFASVVELKSKFKFGIVQYIAIFSLITFFSLFFNGSYHGDISDDVTLRYLHLVSYDFLVMFKIAIIFLIFYFFIAFKNHRIQVFSIYVLLFVLIQLNINVNFISDVYLARYITYSQVDVYEGLERDVKRNSDKNYLVFVPGWWNRSIQKIDTFIPYPNVYWTNLNDVINLKNPKIRKNDYYSFYTKVKYDFKNIDFIFLGKNYYVDKNEATLINSFQDEYLALYAVKNPKRIPKIVRRNGF